MVDNDTFVRSICDDPLNMGLRLVYADWLSENGEEDRAEFLRVQVGISGMIRARACRHCGGKGIRFSINREKQVVEEHPCTPCKSKGYARGSKRSWELVKREQEIILNWSKKEKGWWIGQISKPPYPPGSWFSVENPVTRRDNAFFYFNNGMIEKIRLTMQLFLTHAKQIFSNHPVIRVEIRDRQPDRNENRHAIGYSWEHDWHPLSVPYVIPWDLFDLVMGIRTKNVAENDDDCRDWLSRGCVKMGRELAGLSVLKWPA